MGGCKQMPANNHSSVTTQVRLSNLRLCTTQLHTTQPASAPQVAVCVYLGQRQHALLSKGFKCAHEPLVPGVPDVVAVEAEDV